MVEQEFGAATWLTNKPRFAASLNSLRKRYLLYHSLTSAAKADTENTAVIAAANRCATPNQVQRRVFAQVVKRCPDTKPVRSHAVCGIEKLAACAFRSDRKSTRLNSSHLG